MSLGEFPPFMPNPGDEHDPMREMGNLQAQEQSAMALNEVIALLRQFSIESIVDRNGKAGEVLMLPGGNDPSDIEIAHPWKVTIVVQPTQADAYVYPGMVNGIAAKIGEDSLFSDPRPSLSVGSGKNYIYLKLVSDQYSAITTLVVENHNSPKTGTSGPETGGTVYRLLATFDFDSTTDEVSNLYQMESTNLGYRFYFDHVFFY